MKDKPTDPELLHLWMGAVRDSQNQYHWTDGRSFSYDNWGKHSESTGRNLRRSAVCLEDGIRDSNGDPDSRCSAYALDDPVDKWVMKKCNADKFRAFCSIYSATNSASHA